MRAHDHHLRRTASRLAFALAAGAALVLGPSVAQAQAPGAPAAHHAPSVMHGCPSMNVSAL